ncbi:DMT family transporter [Nereida sp. MMG025]|uniref:DMT family transporter n=1 Tax=Nereida sp. MMG025 TaxID=2909981 RepID=UPI001F44618A|nr:DMT family transporter [Nereida sp. MMG025]MCF6445379.1 DMT family transporter [Nereida sp. MMG025]
MTLTVFCVVVLAALLHATWNAMVKSGSDKFAGMVAMGLGQSVFAGLALVFFPMPALEAWPYLVASIVLHLGYQAFLPLSYQLGDLSQVYPLARGSAPLIVAAVSVVFLGVSLAMAELLGVFLIGIGIVSLGLVRGMDGLRNPVAAGSALITGCFIAGYSLVDGYGARAAGSAVGFFAMSALGTGLTYAIGVEIMRRGTWRAVRKQGIPRALVAGGASFVAYAMVVWAFTQAPIPLVTALRETSIIFALCIGVFIMKERIDLGKVMAVAITLTGVALTRFGKS